MKENSELSELFERSDRGSILYIRHGESIFNLNTFIKQSEDEAKRQKEYLDSKLTDTGIQQSEKLSEQLSKYNLKYIFCSPLQRCIETCFHSLKNHPQKDQIRVIIHPLITETINCNHDFNRNIFEKKRIFNDNSEIKFDWSVFEEYFPLELHQETYFIDYIDSLKDERDIKDLLSKLREEDNYKNIDLMDDLKTKLSAEYDEKKIRPESIKKMFFRNLEFKNYLKLFLDKKDLNLDKILVFTHSNFIQASNSKKAYKLDKMDIFPDDSYKPNNCEIISMFI